MQRRPPTAGEAYGSYEIEAAQGADVRADLASTLVSGGWGLLRLESIGMSLEEIFLRLTTTEEAAEPVADNTSGAEQS